MLSEDAATYQGNAATRDALALLHSEAQMASRQLPLAGSESALVTSETRERVIMPGSRGVDLLRNNEEFAVEKVYMHPKITGLAYLGKHITFPDPNAKEYVSIRDIVEIPGESMMGWYDYDTGDVTPSAE